MLNTKKKESVTNDKDAGKYGSMKQAVVQDLKPEDEIPLVQVIKMERDSGSKLAYRIASCIAEVTAERFAEAVSDMEPEAIEEIMMRLQNADSEALVGMLQVLFIAKGMKYAAEDLDILIECDEFEDISYFLFQDELADTKEFEWFRLKCMLENQIHEGLSEMISVLEED